MIRTQYYTTRQDGVRLYRTYSDSGMMVEQESGALYAEAVDVEGTTHTYTESNVPIPDQEISAEEALDILMGVSE